MKYIFFIIAFYITSFAIVSCGEDRTSEYEELTACDHWMTDVMKQYYLWGDSIKDEKIPWKSFFSNPQSFFTTLTKFAPINDKWSWCSIDTIQEDHHERGYFNHLDSYGLDFLIMTDPTGSTSRQYARIKTVLRNSPADRAGIERGDFIGFVDGNRMSSSNASYLVNGKARKLVVSKLAVNLDENEFYWIQEDTIYMDKSEYVEDFPFPILKFFQHENLNVAYLMCNRLTTGPYETNNESQNYIDSLESVMQKIKNNHPRILVLDFRLCNNGDINMANLFASYVAGNKANNRVFARTIYRESLSANNKIFLFNATGINNAVEPEYIFAITSDYTCGAAEWIIRSLSCIYGQRDFYVIGQKTNGQIVITEEIHSDYYTTLFPAVAFVADENNTYNYENGIEPDIEINEMSYVQLFPYGDKNEVILAYILDLINQRF